ncbi:patatin-like phospholipase domain-containing protein 5 [Puma concolor]|uniref:triacylglycerol lipase n=1 Tax=Puma concolor TaxID=9696 RepID=A0A6P6I3D7_PUMCO|nr:patatin-like phospholipase domain-containing protein 5 [Puma concolor]
MRLLKQQGDSATVLAARGPWTPQQDTQRELAPRSRGSRGAGGTSSGSWGSPHPPSQGPESERKGRLSPPSSTRQTIPVLALGRGPIRQPHLNSLRSWSFDLEQIRRPKLCSSPYFCCSHALGMVKQVERLSLGIFHPAFAPIEHIRQQLQDLLPTDIHVLASQRLGISLTRWPDGHNIIVTDFATRREVIQALVCTLYIPFYCGTIPPEFRGERYFDGGLSNNLPFADSPSTITVSPFHGTVDICPQSTSASIHELNTFNASFQISTKNFFLGFASLISPGPEMVADNCRQGYLDALRFLERRASTLCLA